ncbi:MAG: type II toxin-antitoxin system VapC family toxin [Acidobacteria bacterium]|nr:type II toxin-antitoxin system VapC family toxin [Acidobacteriota bacterium]
MTRFLLDTSAYSSFLRGNEDVQAMLQQADEIYLTPIVLGELRAGFLRGKHRKKNEGELDAFLSSPRVAVVEVDDETATRYAVILHALWRAGTPIPTNDIWIAASAMQRGLRLLTTDAHFRKVSQVIVEYVQAS